MHVIYCCLFVEVSKGHWVFMTGGEPDELQNHCRLLEDGAAPTGDKAQQAEATGSIRPLVRAHVGFRA